MNNVLQDHQKEALCWMGKREAERFLPGGILSDEMGLGKTVTTIAVLLEHPRPKTLVVTTKSLVAQWKQECKRFSTMEIVVHKACPLLQPYKPAGQTPMVVLCSYSSLHAHEIQETNWDRIVLDEGHMIRNANTKLFRHAMQLTCHGPKWILSGTPIYNRIGDFSSLLEFLGMDRYQAQHNPSWARQSLILQRTKEDVCQQREQVSIEQVDVTLSEAEVKHYVDFYKSCTYSTDQHHLLELLLHSRLLCIHPLLYLRSIALKKQQPKLSLDKVEPSSKMQSVLQHIQACPSEDKVVVMCQFLDEMTLFCKALEQRGRVVFRLDGTLTSSKREGTVHMFDSHPGGCVLVVQMATGGVGLNLQAANHIMMVSPTWNVSTELQAIARVHRTGQTKSVHVKRFVTKGVSGFPSIEESMIKLQNEKAQDAMMVVKETHTEKTMPSACQDALHLKDLVAYFSQMKVATYG